MSDPILRQKVKARPLGLRIREYLANKFLKDVHLHHPLLTGRGTISHGIPGPFDVIRWSATQAAIQAGDIGMDTTTGHAQLFVDGATRDVAVEHPETIEMPLEPEGRVTGDSTRLAQANFDGAVYAVKHQCQFNRIGFYVTSVVGAGKLNMRVFHYPGGVIGTAMPRVATVTAFAPTGGQVNFATPTEGTVDLDEGAIAVLWGLESGTSVTMQTYIVQLLRMFNNNAALNAAGVGLHPSIFTTALGSGTTPATFNPFCTAGGGSATPTASDVVPQIRLKKV